MTLAPLAFGPPVEPQAFRAIQTGMALEFCKWDAQVGDASSLFPQPLFISRETWNHLRITAEALAAELLLAELELLERPELHILLGLPAKIRAMFRDTWKREQSPCAIRALRFDFHYTTDGWQISEVNSDVPGGYTEASPFAGLMKGQFLGTESCGDPASEWSRAVLSSVGQGGLVALLSAPGFLEDQQVTAFLASQLQASGMRTLLLHSPFQLRWNSGRATTISKGEEVSVDGVVRFYQGEWIARFPASSGWKNLFFGGKTSVTNPAVSLLSESKRFALTWDKLSARLPTWSALLPESHDPREISWNEDSWVLKAAFSNTGDEIHFSDSLRARKGLQVRRAVDKHPEQWVVQRRFEPAAVSSETGPMFPCLGVYCINGCATGIYARASNQPLIDYRAFDVAVLQKHEQG